MIDLDANATTKPSDSAVAAMNAALVDFWHNPSSVHRAGQAARNAVEIARRQVADLLNVKPAQIVFTGSGTEAIDLAIRGVLTARAGPAPRASPRDRAAPPPIVVSTRVEHAAVRDLLDELERLNAAAVRWAPVDREGIVLTGAIADILAGATICSIQWANNETGGLQPVARIAEACRAAGVVFHCDATQWVGKMPMPRELPCDLLTCSPHKFHGVKGVGVLAAGRGVRFRPMILGTQEIGRRGGTENVPGIVGAGAAAEEARAWLADPTHRQRGADLRDRFERLVLAAVPDAAINGPRDPPGAPTDSARRLWNTTNIAFPRLEAEALLLLLSERGVCASAGAACSSGSLDPSPVLLAMGVPPELAHGSLRFSLSRLTTADEIDAAAGIVIEAVRTLRRSSASAGVG